MPEILEAIMIILFGLSWPASLLKSYKARTAKGKSLLFLVFIFSGYCCGIIAKVVGNSINYVFIFYILNTLMIFTDILLFIRNSFLDRKTA